MKKMKEILMEMKKMVKIVLMMTLMTQNLTMEKKRSLTWKLI